MEKVFTLGLTEESMKEITWMTKNLGSESTVGLMEEDMKVTGKMGSNMAKATTMIMMENAEKADGLKEKEQNGKVESINNSHYF